MTSRRTTLAWLTAPAVGFAGCASSPAPRWHNLVGTAPAGPPAPATGPELRLAVARVHLPEEVDRPQLVLRQGEAVNLLDGQRWSEPLKAQLPRALALALGQRLPGARVSAYPAASAAAWRLVVEVQRFELHAGAQPQALLQALWSWRADDPATPSRSGRSDLRSPAAGAAPDALVAAMAHNVEALAQAAAAALCGAAAC